MKKTFLVPSVLLFAGLLLVGAGCDERSTQKTSMAPAPSNRATSTPEVVQPIVPTTSEEDPLASRALSLTGDLPQLGQTTLLFTLGKDRVLGRFETATQHGSVYGTVSSTLTEAPIQLSLLVGDEDVLLVSGSYSPVSGSFMGFAQRSEHAPRQAITLTSFVPTEGASIQLKKIEREKALTRGMSCHTTLEYPVVLANAFVTQEHADLINKQIRSFLGESSTTTLEGLADASQADCVNTLSDVASSTDPLDDEPSGMNQYEYDTETMVTRNASGLLSFVYSSYSYTGGAHPNTIQYAQTFDLSTGKQLAFSDLVRDDARATWIQREQRALLLSEYGDMLFEKGEAERIAKGSLKGVAASSTAAYQSLDQWYLIGNTLVRYYQSYEIAPYSAGIPTIELPFATWRDLAVASVERWFK